MRKPLQSVVSLVPSATESLFSLGLGSKVVGVTEQCRWPEDANDRVRVGSFAFPEIAKVASLKPDLVVVHPRIHDRYVRELRERGLNTFTTDPKTVEDILREMEQLCTLIGPPEPGLSLISSLKARLDEVKRKVAEGGRKRPKVFRLMVESPLFTPTSSSYQYDAIVIAGGEPFAPSAEGAYAQVPLEAVIKFNPEVIVSCGRSRDEEPKERCHGCEREHPACQRSVEEIRSWGEWQVIDAVRRGTIYTLHCEWICRPGPRLFEGIERMAAFLHGIAHP